MNNQLKSPEKKGAISLTFPMVIKQNLLQIYSFFMLNKVYYTKARFH